MNCSIHGLATASGQRAQVEQEWELDICLWLQGWPKSRAKRENTVTVCHHFSFFLILICESSLLHPSSSSLAAARQGLQYLLSPPSALASASPPSRAMPSRSLLVDKLKTSQACILTSHQTLTSICNTHRNTRIVAFVRTLVDYDLDSEAQTEAHRLATEVCQCNSPKQMSREDLSPRVSQETGAYGNGKPTPTE